MACILNNNKYGIEFVGFYSFIGETAFDGMKLTKDSLKKFRDDLDSIQINTSQDIQVDQLNRGDLKCCITAIGGNND